MDGDDSFEIQLHRVSANRYRSDGSLNFCRCSCLSQGRLMNAIRKLEVRTSLNHFTVG